MTNREYLEFAAKAAGIPLRDLDDRWDNWEPEPVRIHRGWNPLENDGDALRLAVKLGLLISHSAYKPGENAYGFIGIAWYGQRVEFKPEKFTDDPYAATRRAVVRAAAEIGRSMK